jgi:hypothetical protein
VMSILVILCFAFAALLGAIGASNRPAPPPFNFLAAAVAFLALGLLLQVFVAGPVR